MWQEVTSQERTGREAQVGGIDNHVIGSRVRSEEGKVICNSSSNEDRIDVRVFRNDLGRFVGHVVEVVHLPLKGFHIRERCLDGVETGLIAPSCDNGLALGVKSASEFSTEITGCSDDEDSLCFGRHGD